ncbi:MAG: 30S ribosomal protein S17 [Proteobacteria bacterium]|nr:30S ribosomal protein S17 [Pseudomonadota bacterium]MBU1686025.1 30S ribosomal protein S17 [Pseudomonadota bacterium]
MAEVGIQRHKQKLTGVVVSTRMQNTVVVRIERLVQHKLYGKFMRRHVKYMADDPNGDCNVGDRITIEECRPLSKHKRWRLREIVERAA